MTKKLKPLLFILLPLLILATFIGLIGHKINQYDAKLNLIKQQLNITCDGLSNQWYLYNRDNPGHDLNIVPVWQQGITGKGVTICINDLHGLDYARPEFREKYVSEGSFDFLRNDSDPMPRNRSEIHANLCGGVAAGSKGSGGCGIGVAYDSKLSSIRRGPEIDRIEVLSYRNDINDIYSCSWGEDDDGMTISSLGPIFQESISYGINQGRLGLGSIYVFAAGNGAQSGDNCNFDNYSNSIYTISVGGIDESDTIADYSEGCSALLLVAYSGQSYTRGITSSNGDQCGDKFYGTSAATPMVAGAVALMLQVRPDLGWRDVQNILIQTGKPIDILHPSWDITYSGAKFSNLYGFGKLDVNKTVELTRSYTKLPQSINYEVNGPSNRASYIPKSQNGVKFLHRITQPSLIIEQVTVRLTLHHPIRRDISINLISPNNITSRLIESRHKDTSRNGFNDFTTMSLKHWGEPIEGVWQLQIIDNNRTPKSQTMGVIYDYYINFYGHKSI